MIAMSENPEEPRLNGEGSDADPRGDHFPMTRPSAPVRSHAQQIDDALLKPLKDYQKYCDIKNNPEKIKLLAVAELCGYLEEGKIAVKLVDQTKLYGCILRWESKGFTENMISQILGKSARTIRRYQKEIRDEQVAYEREDCFTNIFASISRRFQARGAYYIRLANTLGISPTEKREAMDSAHQVDMDLIDVFVKLKSKYTKS